MHASTDEHGEIMNRRVSELLSVYSAPDLSVCHVLCDQHADDDVAYTVLNRDLQPRRLTYGELRDASERFASGLAGLGVSPGDRVATLLGKSIEHLVAVMGIWRLGAVQMPLFTAFAPPAIAMRLESSRVKLVVCDEAQRPKLTPADGAPVEDTRRIIVVGDAPEASDVSFDDLLTHHPAGFTPASLGGDAPMIEMYTSGTTGRPKAVTVPSRALASFHAYMDFGLHLQPDDVFWNAADPSWGYGLYYGIIGTFLVGAPSVWLEGGFSADLTLQVLSEWDVSNFGAGPTVYRSLAASGAKVPSRIRLRSASAAGEPLTPEINEWARSAFGVEVHDHYGQTETGMTINNHHHPLLSRPLKAGSMGDAMPGWSPTILMLDEDAPAEVGTLGRIAFDLTDSPLAWFHGYRDDPEKSAEKFSADGRWYITGDTARMDEDGYMFFQSRDDDIIIMAGYRIGPFEVESVLLTHEGVVEAAVIAAPDSIRGEVLEAYVVLRDNLEPSPSLESDLQELVKTRFAAHAYPRTVHFVDALPKTASGKVKRNVLRERRRAKLQGSSSPSSTAPLVR